MFVNHQVSWHPGQHQPTAPLVQQPGDFLNPIPFPTWLRGFDGSHLLGWHPTRASEPGSDGWVKIVVIDFRCFSLKFFIFQAWKQVQVDWTCPWFCWRTWCMLDRCTMNCGIRGHIEAIWHTGIPNKQLQPNRLIHKHYNHLALLTSVQPSVVLSIRRPPWGPCIWILRHITSIEISGSRMTRNGDLRIKLGPEFVELGHKNHPPQNMLPA